MTLSPGARLGPYTIVGALGAGGMGEVYRARDSRLQRDVAIKTLPEALAFDGDRLRRFEREAQVLASLNHPHIAALYGLEEADGVRALVMELVEGSTLAERISSGPMDQDEALAIAVQIAEALEAAHEQGLVHRDLKPANIKVRPDGTVKVLDFGLAKAYAGETPAVDILNSPTITATGTMSGVILGTAAYMSPEQARGRMVDRRADIWAFGCVLFEMLTGQTAFAADSTAETIVNVFQREPDWHALPQSTPARIRDLLRRCLSKDARRRLRDIGDARMEIEETLASTPTAGSAATETRPAGSRRSWRRLIAAAVAGAAVTLVLGLLALWLRTGDQAPTFDRVIRLVSTPAHEFGAAISPDGKWVAYLSNARGPTDVWVKFIAGGDAANLTASAGVDVQSQDAIGGLDVSPDGALIAFGAVRQGEPATQGSTWVIAAPLGGVPRKLLRASEQGLRWSSDGKRIAYMRAGASAGDAVMVADADGQNPRELVAPQFGRHTHWLRWSPDGRYVYFNYGFQNLNLEPTEIVRVSSSGGPIEPVVRTARRAVDPFPSADGHGLFYAANPDGVDLKLFWRDLGTGRDYRLTTGVGEYSEPCVSLDGRRLVATVTDVQQALDRVPVTFDHTTVLEPLTDGFSGDLDPSWSSDGTRLVFSSSRTGNRNIWTARADVSQPAPLTSGPAIDERPAYSPDGQQVAFVSDRGGRRGIWIVNVDGGSPRLISAADVLDTISWSPDGRTLVYAAPGGTSPGLMTVSVADGTAARLPTPAGAFAPAWSPSDDVIAYLEPHPGVGTYLRLVNHEGRPQQSKASDAPQQFSNGYLAWSPDGRRIAAVGLPGNRTGSIWIVTLDNAAPFRKLIDLPSGVYLRGVTWSRDSSALVIGHIRWAGDIVLAERLR
jgi:Tol biopolymer transport system component